MKSLCLMHYNYVYLYNHWPLQLLPQTQLQERGLHYSQLQERGLHYSQLQEWGLHYSQLQERGLHYSQLQERGLHYSPSNFDCVLSDWLTRLMKLSWL